MLNLLVKTFILKINHIAHELFQNFVKKKEYQSLKYFQKKRNGEKQNENCWANSD